jgi:hypothetical protein
MSTATLYRWAGIVGIVAGVLNIIVEFVPDSLGTPLNLLVVLLALWVLAALYVRQRQASGVLGFIGYIINTFGLALVVGLVFAQVFVLSALDAALVGELFAGTTGLAALVSLVIFTLGVVLFGIAIIRANVFPKWAAVLYIVGFLPVAVSPFIPGIIVSIGEVVASIGIIWLGYGLWSGAGETTEQAEAAT